MLNFTGRKAFTRERDFVRDQARTIVGDTNEPPSGLLDLYPDGMRSGIQGVLHEFFHNAGRSFHHLTGGDLLLYVRGEGYE